MDEASVVHEHMAEALAEAGIALDRVEQTLAQALGYAVLWNGDETPEVQAIKDMARLADELGDRILHATP